jgi:hypothetical protein
MIGVFVAVCLTACSPSLGTLQPARTTPAGHLQMTTSFDVVDTSGEIRETLEAAKTMDIGSTLNAGEIERIADAAAIGLVQPPSIGYQISAAYGLNERFELGLRTSVSALRGHLRFQWLRVAPGVYGSLAAGVSGYLFGFPLQTVGDDVSLAGFMRWDFDFPLHIGYSNRWLHVWGGPKLVLSTYETDVSVCIDRTSGNCRRSAAAHASGTAAYITGQLGLALGYRRFWIAGEITVGRIGTSGGATITNGRRTDEGTFAHEGLVVAPSVGFIVWI